MDQIKTLKIRIKDKHSSLLDRQAKEVNFVWNFVNDLSHNHTKKTGKFFSGYDLSEFTAGATKEGLTIPSASIQAINEEYATRRKQFKKIKLKWRKTRGTNRSLGWIPFKKSSITYKNGQIHYQKMPLQIWDSYGLSQYELGSGSFTEDSRGRWYLNITVKIAGTQSTGTGSVGIDLGCKASATTSNGDVLDGRKYRKYEAQLRRAQRARKKVRVRAIHDKIKNTRKDEMHKFTRKLVNENSAIFVGDVSSSKLIKTKMAKSVLDAGWSQLKTTLEYKCRYAGVVFEVVNEKFSTQTCSCCGCISTSSPKGRAGLRIREWTCNECGTHHDRDVNAAMNILVAGHGHLAGGIPCL